MQRTISYAGDELGTYRQSAWGEIEGQIASAEKNKTDYDYRNKQN